MNILIHCIRLWHELLLHVSSFRMYICAGLLISGAGPDSDASTTSIWSRAKLEKRIDPSVDAIIFQQVDIDHYIGN